MSKINTGDSADRRTEGSLHRDGYAARVTYSSLSKSQRKWDVIFDLGSDAANDDAAVAYALKNYATISASAQRVNDTHQTANVAPMRHNDQALRPEATKI